MNIERLVEFVMSIMYLKTPKYQIKLLIAFSTSLEPS